jgi:hypothetical protein
MRFDREKLLDLLKPDVKLPVRQICTEAGCCFATYYRYKRQNENCEFASLPQGHKRPPKISQKEFRIIRIATENPRFTLSEIVASMRGKISMSAAYGMLCKNNLVSESDRVAAGIVLKIHPLFKATMAREKPRIILPDGVKITHKARWFLGNSEVYFKQERRDRAVCVGYPGYLGLLSISRIRGLPSNWNMTEGCLMRFIDLFSGFELWDFDPSHSIDAAASSLISGKVPLLYDKIGASLETLALPADDFHLRGFLRENKWRPEKDIDENKLMKFRSSFKQFHRTLSLSSIEFIAVRSSLVNVLPIFQSGLIPWIRRHPGCTSEDFRKALLKVPDEINQKPRRGRFSYGRSPAETLAASKFLIPVTE